MSIRLNKTDIACLSPQYAVGKVSKTKDISVRFKCLVEVVISAAKCAYHTLNETYAEVRHSFSNKKERNNWKQIKQRHTESADESEKDCKVYFLAVRNPKLGLPRIALNGAEKFANSVINGVVKQLIS